MNRKRKPNEAYKTYKEALKKEEKKLKNYLCGKLIWCSKRIFYDSKERA